MNGKLSYQEILDAIRHDMGDEIANRLDDLVDDMKYDRWSDGYHEGVRDGSDTW